MSQHSKGRRIYGLLSRYDILMYCPALMWSTISVLIQDAVTICTLGTGTAFGESILDNTPRHATIVTREFSELLRIEQREFRSLWEVSASVCSVCICISLQKISGCTELCDTSLSLTQGTSERLREKIWLSRSFCRFCSVWLYFLWVRGVRFETLCTLQAMRNVRDAFKCVFSGMKLWWRTNLC